MEEHTLPNFKTHYETTIKSVLQAQEQTVIDIKRIELWVQNKQTPCHEKHNRQMMLNFKHLETGTEKMAQQLEHWLFFQRTQVQFPAHTWLLTTICDSQYRGSSAPFLYSTVYGPQTYTQAKHPDTVKKGGKERVKVKRTTPSPDMLSLESWVLPCTPQTVLALTFAGLVLPGLWVLRAAMYLMYLSGKIDNVFSFHLLIYLCFSATLVALMSLFVWKKTSPSKLFNTVTCGFGVPWISSDFLAGGFWPPPL